MEKPICNLKNQKEDVMTLLKTATECLQKNGVPESRIEDMRIRAYRAPSYRMAKNIVMEYVKDSSLPYIRLPYSNTKHYADQIKEGAQNAFTIGIDISNSKIHPVTRIKTMCEYMGFTVTKTDASEGVMLFDIRRDTSF